MGFADRLVHAWNAFLGIDPVSSKVQPEYKLNLGQTFYSKPDRIIPKRGSERSIVGSIYNRMANDVSSLTFKHVKLDDQERYSETIHDGINECLTLSSNKDQTSRAFIRDLVLTMLEEGCAVVVPVDTTADIHKTNIFDILSWRVGKITQWYPDDIKAEVYNDRTGNKVEIILPKQNVAIIDNPYYSVMNEPNSTLQRLTHKLAISDVIDEKSGSNKLDMIIQLPYVLKGETRKAHADERRKEIEDQLKSSDLGIAYTDGTEKIIQLNRPIENNLQKQVEYLMSMLFSQLGITMEILNGTADDKTMTNYINRTIKPIADAIVDEMKRKFLTKTARTQKQSIMYFNDPFKLVPVSNLADIADKFTRNEIMSSNEMRQVVGLIPVKDPKADELRNKNINVIEGETFASTSKIKNTESETVESNSNNDLLSIVDLILYKGGKNQNG